MRPVTIVLTTLLLIAGQVRAEPVTAPQAEKGAFAVADLFVQAQAGAERMVREILDGAPRPEALRTISDKQPARSWR
jgi:hypothetical protein